MTTIFSSCPECADYCDGCGHCKIKKTGQWWFLQNYHGITGYFCPDCYNKVEHRDDKPLNPEGFCLIKIQLELEKNK